MTRASGGFIHANALVLGETGLLIRGPSGAGKSALTLALLARSQSRGDLARLVGDDRVRVDLQNGRLVARPHPSIAGMIEIRGLGLARIAFEAACVLRAIVDVRPADETLARFPEDRDKCASLHGIPLPRLQTTNLGDVSVERILFFIQSVTTI